MVVKNAIDLMKKMAAIAESLDPYFFKEPISIKLVSFEELGLNQLDMCEVYIMLEKEFYFEISEDDCETFTSIVLI